MMRYMKKKIPGFLDRGMPFTSIFSHWQLSKGLLSVYDGFCDMGDLQMGFIGTLSLEQQGTDAWVRLLVHEDVPGLLAEIPPIYLFTSHGYRQVQPMFGHITGTGNDLYLKAYRQRNVPKSAASDLRQIIPPR